MGYATKLTPQEEEFALWIAKQRNQRSTANGDKPAHGAPNNDNPEAALKANLVGARGEVAVARLLNQFPNLSVYHEEKVIFDGHDLPHRVSIRAAQKRFGLLVRPGDADDGRYVAVVAAQDHVVVLGWMGGAAAKQPQWLSQPKPPRPPCYLIPEAQLLPISKLRLLIASEMIASVAA